ncbi:MAG: hypothetical protein DCC55_16140 [Chloroflexi bacterium]|nr:MAG: hypothetical protein DCC55_16140 [Chloroflexota bacterium]
MIASFERLLDTIDGNNKKAAHAVDGLNLVCSLAMDQPGCRWRGLGSGQHGLPGVRLHICIAMRIIEKVTAVG